MLNELKPEEEERLPERELVPVEEVEPSSEVDSAGILGAQPSSLSESNELDCCKNPTED